MNSFNGMISLPMSYHNYLDTVVFRFMFVISPERGLCTSLLECRCSFWPSIFMLSNTLMVRVNCASGLV